MQKCVLFEYSQQNCIPPYYYFRTVKVPRFTHKKKNLFGRSFLNVIIMRCRSRLSLLFSHPKVQYEGNGDWGERNTHRDIHSEISDDDIQKKFKKEKKNGMKIAFFLVQ